MSLLSTPDVVSRADAVKFQSWLHSRQYPQDCSATVGLRARQDYFYSLGLGAQMVSLKFNFIDALLKDKVYHFPTTHYINPLRCPSRSFDCYFAQPTNCTWERSAPGAHHARVEQTKIHWCFDLPRRKLSRLAGLRAVHAKEWYHAQLSSFLFRPSADTVAFARELYSDMEGSEGGAVSSKLIAQGASPTPTPGRVHGNGSCVAMHIRRTDKHTEDHRTAQRSFSDFAQLFKAWGYWKYDGAVTGLRAFIGSEDKKTFSEMPPILQPYGAYWIPAKYFVMDGSSGKKFHDIRQGNSRLGELYGGLEDAAKQGSGGASTSTGLHKDEGLVLITQILLMSGCEALLGSYSSNVAVLVHDLMLARKIMRGEPMHAMDVNGRLYCGCGASFCMNLERKTVRDVGRSIKHVVDGFKYR